MDKRDIDALISAGWWVSVSPVMKDDKWGWTCGIYKRGKKTGNWVTENCKTFESPGDAYDWALTQLKPVVNKGIKP